LIATSSLIAVIAEPVSYNAINRVRAKFDNSNGCSVFRIRNAIDLFSFNALKFYQISIVLGLSFYLGYLILVVFAMSVLLALIIAMMAFVVFPPLYRI
jgi:hypothetical protein